VNNLAFSPDGRLLAVAAGRLGIIDPGNRQGQVVYLAGHQGAVQAAAFTPDGKTLVSIGQFDGTILTWDVSGLAAR
jgi:WD40 repeat protein